MLGLMGYFSIQNYHIQCLFCSIYFPFYNRTGKLILPVIKYTKNALLCVSKMLSIEKWTSHFHTTLDHQPIADLVLH